MDPGVLEFGAPALYVGPVDIARTFEVDVDHRATQRRWPILGVP
jgi:hypothetical protein